VPTTNNNRKLMFSDKYMILSISFKHTTGDYSDVEHPLKPLEHISMIFAKKSPQQQFEGNTTMSAVITL
jgi:hypothetical protein